MRKLLIFTLVCLLAFPISAAPPEKYVALTFDDGPSGRFTRTLLDGLEERGIPATFLLCGYRMEQYPELVQRIYREGHEIGIHGYSHKCMGDMCLAELEKEISDCMCLLPEGCEPVFLRPPGGKTSPKVCEAAANAGLSLLSWDVDPKDWATHRTEQVIASVVKQVQDGDVVLLHDMSDSSVRATLAIIDALQNQGYRFVTVSQLADLRGTTLVPGKVYSKFPAKG